MSNYYYEYVYLCRLWFKTANIERSELHQVCMELIKYFDLIKLTPLGAGLHRLPFIPNVLNYIESNQGKLRFSLQCSVPKSSMMSFNPVPSVSIEIPFNGCEFKAIISKWETLTTPKMCSNVSLIH